MAHPAYLREKALQLRRERRLTIDQLAERLALPRSTIYYWVRDIPIPGSGSGGEWPASARRKGTRAMQRKYRLLREAAYREGAESYAELVLEPTFRDFVCLYIAEGYKRSRSTVSICNSDPRVMCLADRWIRRLTRRPVDYAVTYHADQDPERLAVFWSEQLDVPRGAVRCIRKCEHGVLAVASHDTYFRARLGAWVEAITREWAQPWG